MSQIIFIQYGDYKLAFENLNSGGSEKYYAQAHSVQYVESLTARFDKVLVLCLAVNYPCKVLANGVVTIGVDVSKVGASGVVNYIASLSLTHIVLRSPIVKVMSYAIKNKIALLPILADSFVNKSIRNKVSNFFLMKILNNKSIKIVSNHSLNSCLSLVKIGVNKSKVIPWDWPHCTKPEDFLVKSMSSNSPILFYAGQMTKEKGLYDLIDAVGVLNKTKPVFLTIAGNDTGEKVGEYILNKGLQKQVTLLGLVPQKNVVDSMAEADAVIVPSWHEYPEGLPMTIYEGLASRTPLIVSDHPMFTDKVVDNVSGLVFEAGNVESLAFTCLKLFNDDDLYNMISFNSLQAWHDLNIKDEWSQVVDYFIDDELSQVDIKNKSLMSYEVRYV